MECANDTRIRQMSETTIDAKSRREMILAEMAACTECGQYRFPKHDICPDCIAAVDNLIAALRHEDDK